jgi:hypothetical protein
MRGGRQSLGLRLLIAYGPIGLSERNAVTDCAIRALQQVRSSVKSVSKVAKFNAPCVQITQLDQGLNALSGLFGLWRNGAVGGEALVGSQILCNKTLVLYFKSLGNACGTGCG